MINRSIYVIVFSLKIFLRKNLFTSTCYSGVQDGGDQRNCLFSDPFFSSFTFTCRHSLVLAFKDLTRLIVFDLVFIFFFWYPDLLTLQVSVLQLVFSSVWINSPHQHPACFFFFLKGEVIECFSRAKSLLKKIIWFDFFYESISFGTIVEICQICMFSMIIFTLWPRPEFLKAYVLFMESRI